LARLHFHKHKQEEEDYKAKRAAYYNLVSISHLMGEGSKSFDDVFPMPKKKPTPLTQAERKAEFSKHNMVLVEE
jgi:hypothetical protein